MPRPSVRIRQAWAATAAATSCAVVFQLQRTLLLTHENDDVSLVAAGVHGRNRGRASGVQDERPGAVP